VAAAVKRNSVTARLRGARRKQSAGVGKIQFAGATCWRMRVKGGMTVRKMKRMIKMKKRRRWRIKTILLSAAAAADVAATVAWVRG
jgi:hypothetical protein